jgi:antirestriction protein ArdC
MSKSKRDLYAEVTADIDACLARGVVPWRKPWRAGDDAHRNPVSGTLYRGVNPMLLEIAALTRGYSDRRWVTFKGAQSLGGQIRKGETGRFVVFFKRLLVEDENNGQKVKKVIPMLRHFVVFNVDQCEGIDLPAEPEREPFEPIDRCESIVAGYVDGGPRLNHHGGDEACYVPRADMVNMPHPELFEDRSAYYSTLFHELGHSTGHTSRLNRPDLGHPFGSKGYAREELTAELTAAMVCGVCAIDPDAQRIEQSAAYIASWRKALNDDPRCVVIAAQRAQKAADLLTGESAREETETPALVAA